jgi:hypothetical protein
VVAVVQVVPAVQVLQAALVAREPKAAQVLQEVLVVHHS